MFQLSKNISTDFLVHIFPELSEFKTRSLFGGHPVLYALEKPFMSDFTHRIVRRQLGVKLAWNILQIFLAFSSFQVILAGTLTRVQGDIRCKVLAAISTVQYLLVT